MAVGHRPAQTSMLDVEFAQLSDAGRVREHNEDYLGHVLPATPAEARTHGWLFALADGVGGHAKARLLRAWRWKACSPAFARRRRANRTRSLLPRLVQAANAQVFETGLAAGPGGSSMSTTLVACALRFDRAAVAHVGDSRCYLIRRGHATLLTRDHTVASEQVRLGVLSAQRSRRGAHAPRAQPLPGKRTFVSAEINDHQVHAGRFAAAVLRRAARRGGGSGHRAASSAIKPT